MNSPLNWCLFSLPFLNWLFHCNSQFVNIWVELNRVFFLFLTSFLVFWVFEVRVCVCSSSSVTRISKKNLLDWYEIRVFWFVHITLDFINKNNQTNRCKLNGQKLVFCISWIIHIIIPRSVIVNLNNFIQLLLSSNRREYNSSYFFLFVCLIDWTN